MTYITGQPIIFVGCGQVSLGRTWRGSTVLTLMVLGNVVDLHGFKAFEGQPYRRGLVERLKWGLSGLSRLFRWISVDCSSCHVARTR
jgi:hypothetical protein